jgi:hypothetical protein
MFNFNRIDSRGAQSSAELNSQTERRRTSLMLGVFFAILVGLLAPGAAYSQVLYGSLVGNVTDPNHQVVPGAKVDAVNDGTGETKSVVTDSNGGYSFSSLQVGTYKITVSMKSFKTVLKEDVRVEANVVRRVDAQLEVGEVTETVVINSAQEATLQTDKADVNTQLQAKQIQDLPITSSAGRNFQALYKLVPGFSIVTEGQSSDGGNPQRTMGGFVNGNSQQGNSTRIDGASNSYMWLPFNTAYVPPTESIESVNVVTNSYDAEQGNASGASTSVTTKTGTNEFHGSAFEFHTDNALKAFPRFATPNTRKNKFILNQFGGALGGPIYMPIFGEGGPSIWRGKNKLFFFTDLEWTKRNQLASRTVTAINPAGIFDAAGNANLSAAIPAGTNCNVTPVAGCVFDPNTGTATGAGRLAFPGNIIPANRIDPAAKLMLSRIRPTGFLNNDGVTATNNYNSTGSAQLNRRTFDLKINYVMSNKSTLFGRYSRSNALLVDPPTLGDAMGGATGGGQVGLAPSKIQNVGLGGMHAFSPTLVIDANVGFTRQKLGAVYAPDVNLGNFGVTTLGIPGTNGTSPLAGGTPAFMFTTGGWNAIGNSDTGNPFQFRDNQYVGNVNMSWIRGKHDLRFGGEFSRSEMNHFQPQGGAFQTPRGSFRFSGNVTALNATGAPAANKANSLAQYLLGVPNEVGKAVQNANPNSLRWNTWSAYGRDRWQVTPNLTINAGLRWEYYPMATADHGGVKLFNPATGNVLIGGYGSTPLDDGVDVGHGQFLPRFGLAYRWKSKMVIRLGYGMSADSNNWRFFRNNYPATTNSDVNGATSFAPAGSLTGETLAPYPGLPVGIPFVAIPDISTGVIAVPNGVNPGNTIPFKFNRGYIHSYNLTLQRDWKGIVAEAAYIGTRGIRLLTNENINSAPLGTGEAGRPLNAVAGRNYGNVNCLCPDANSYYDALQTKVTKRFGHGSYISGAYTFSKAINSDDSEEVSIAFGVQGGFLFWPNPLYKSRNKALASYDRTHNFVLYGLYELPFGKRERWAKGGVLSKVLGGWQLNYLLQRMSGNMFTLQGGGAGANAPGNFQTPDQIAPLVILGGIGPLPGQPACAATDMTCHYFDPRSFAAVPATAVRFGSSGRNIIRGPGFFNLDASIFRNFDITEKVKFQLRMEMFGVTNTPHFANPGVDVTNPAAFGVITGTLNLAGRGTGTGGERQVWFAAKLIF